MISIYDDLSTLGYPVFEEGSAPEELPAEYFTFREDYSSDNLSADNQAKEILYEFTIKWYTNDKTHIYSGLESALALLKSQGYITTGVGYANNVYKDTYFSRQADIKRLEYI